MRLLKNNMHVWRGELCYYKIFAEYSTIKFWVINFQFSSLVLSLRSECSAPGHRLQQQRASGRFSGGRRQCFAASDRYTCDCCNFDQKFVTRIIGAGSFFLPRDQQRMKPAKTTDYEGLAYLGEFPLAWAACCNNESAYNLLIDNDANPDERDTFGNMILHMVVRNPLLKFFCAPILKDYN
jgi:hypothetical protein